MPQRASFKVYYEDTDSLGVVYYANYFKYLERGRSEYFAAAGLDVAAINAGGTYIVVHHVDATFRKPAALGEIVDIISTFTIESAYRGRFAQRIERAGELLVDATIDVVCLGESRTLIEFPAPMRAIAE